MRLRDVMLEIKRLNPRGRKRIMEETAYRVSFFTKCHADPLKTSTITRAYSRDYKITRNFSEYA
jgi:hypothetical protein